VPLEFRDAVKGTGSLVNFVRCYGENRLPESRHVPYLFFMSRRSTPQAKIDREAWPVTVRVLVPPNGFGRNDPSEWLRTELGLTEFATTPARLFLNEAVAYHFRSVETARAFCERFPMLQLADGTTSCAYRSPHLPFGRQWQKD